MKVLVTGGAGFIGSNVVDGLIEEGYEVVVVDNLVTGKRENLNPRAKFYEVDIRSQELADIFDKERPDYVNHHAAQIDVRKSVSDPLYDAEVNVLGTINLLENCLRHEVKKVVFASSGGTVYGEPEYLPADENHPIKPVAPYGLTKYVGELYLDYYYQTKRLNYVSLRYGNVYGPRQDPHGEAGVIAIFVNAMLKGNQPRIFGDGEQLRDYVYVEDVVRANMLALKAHCTGVFNIGTGIGTSVNELYSHLSQLIGFNKPAIYAPPREGELQKIYLSYELARQTFNWEPLVGLSEGLKRTVEYFRRGGVTPPLL